MRSLNIRERQSRGVTIVDLDGSITLGETNRQLHDTLKQIVAENKKEVILNLARVKRVDSSGLGEIVAGFTTVKAIGGTLKLLSLPPNVADLMTMTKLLTVFDIFDDESEAVSSFESDEAGTSKAAAGVERVTQELPENFEPEVLARSSVQ